MNERTWTLQEKYFDDEIYPYRVLEGFGRPPSYAIGRRQNV